MILAIAFAPVAPVSAATPALKQELLTNLCANSSPSKPEPNQSADAPDSSAMAGETCVGCAVKDAVAASKASDVAKKTAPIALVLDTAVENERVKRDLAYFKFLESNAEKVSPLYLQMSEISKSIKSLKLRLATSQNRYGEFTALSKALTSLETEPPTIESNQKQAIAKILRANLPELKKGVSSEQRETLWSALVFLDWAESPTYDIPRPLEKALSGTKKWFDAQATKLQKESNDHRDQIKKMESALADLRAKLSPEGEITAADLAELNKYEAKYKDYPTRQNKGFQTCGMSIAELHALRNYTATGYRTLNQSLREGNIEPVAPFKDVLESALEKLRQQQLNVRRGAILPESELKKHQVGAIVTYDSFTSTSIEGGFPKAHKFIIQSKTGKYIAPFSNSSYEEEVLIPAGAKFKILSRTQKGKEIEFVMEEVME